MNTANRSVGPSGLPVGSTIGFNPSFGIREAGTFPKAMASFTRPNAKNPLGPGSRSSPFEKPVMWVLCSTRSPSTASATFNHFG